MEQIRSYILSVTAAGIFCAMTTALCGKNGTISSIIRIMNGVVLAAVMLTPLTQITTVSLNRYLNALNADASAAVEAGTAASEDAVKERIRDRVRAYILDKAAQLDTEINVIVQLDDQYVPTEIIITGSISPIARNRLETVIEEDLGIPKEAQLWK